MPSKSPDPLAVTSFARIVGLALVLGTSLAGKPAAAQAVRQATLARTYGSSEPCSTTYSRKVSSLVDM